MTIVPVFSHRQIAAGCVYDRRYLRFGAFLCAGLLYTATGPSDRGLIFFANFATFDAFIAVIYSVVLQHFGAWFMMAGYLKNESHFLNFLSGSPKCV
jgi:hypothetical protein